MINSFNSFNENIEWGRFYNKDAKEYLDNVFTIFTNPIEDNYIPAYTRREKIGMDMMAFYIVEIPFKPKNKTIDEFSKLFNSINDDIKDCINRIKSKFPKSGHNVEFIDKNNLATIKLTIWNKN